MPGRREGETCVCRRGGWEGLTDSGRGGPFRGDAFHHPRHPRDQSDTPCRSLPLGVVRGAILLELNPHQKKKKK